VSRARATGEGTVYKRRDGRWEGALYLPTLSGTRKRYRCYGHTRQQVNTKLVELQARAQHGRLLPDRSWKLSDYLDYWLENVVRVNRRPKTYESYEAAVRLYLRPRLGGTYLQRLTVAQVQTALNRELAQGSSIRTAHLIRLVLSAALTRAMREELVERNVARLVELPAWQRKDITPWTAKQLASFLAAAQSDPFYPAFLLLALYGLRRGEVLGLRWRDVDGHQLHIRQQVQRVGGKLTVGPVKTSAGRRDLPLLVSARMALDQHAAHLRQQVQAGLRQTGSTELIFTTRTGQPVEPHNFMRSFTRLRAEQGLPHSTLHHLRHATATLLKNSGLAARDAQLILGHAHISTTQQLYQHADLAGQRRGLEVVETSLLTAVSSVSCRQMQPSSSWASTRYIQLQSGGPGGTRTLDTLLKRTTVPNSPQHLTEVRSELRSRYCSHLLGAAAVMFSRQLHPSSPPHC
jgi:integrase